MEQWMYLPIFSLIGINMAAFVIYGVDKWKAVHHKWRIPESVLLLLAAAGGALGALLGMRIWNHKTRKPKFYILVPLLLVLWSAAVIWIAYPK
ncbi:MAG: DUF1294 domain-containing protein [Eubacteriales bacterium]|nr:DUF1294 domain-containing protein [Eubacteriales bacterium]